MKRVTGLGGIFFKAKDAAGLQAWYKRHLGIDVQPWGGAAFDWTDEQGNPVGGTTAWSIAPTASSAGSSIRKATRSSYGNRPPASDHRKQSHATHEGAPSPVTALTARLKSC
jgi:hypothetical protein